MGDGVEMCSKKTRNVLTKLKFNQVKNAMRILQHVQLPSPYAGLVISLGRALNWSEHRCLGS